MDIVYMCVWETIWFPDKTISNQCRFCLANQISLQLNVADGISKLKNRQKSKTIRNEWKIPMNLMNLAHPIQKGYMFYKFISIEW